MEYPTAVEWKMSVQGSEENYGDDNILSLIRLTCIEVSRVIRAAFSLILILFSVIQVIARLIEYLLDVIIVITTIPDKRTQTTTSTNSSTYGADHKTFRLIIALVAVILMGWFYIELLARPVYRMIEDYTTLVAKILSIEFLTTHEYE